MKISKRISQTAQLWICLLYGGIGTSYAQNSRDYVIDYTQYVDSFIGTMGRGHTFPGATTPFGFIQLSPDTGNDDWDYIGGYQYDDESILGFSHSHLSGGGRGDLGDVLLLPFTDSLPLGENPKIEFYKESEVAIPGYYSLVTKDSVKVELTATQRTGYHEYTFPKEDDQKLFINADRILYNSNKWKVMGVFDGAMTIVDGHTITGSYFSKAKVDRTVYFAIKFDQPIKNFAFLDKETKRKAIVNFGKDRSKIVVRASLSTVSTAGALENIKAESLGRSLGDIVSHARTKWNQYLSKIHIEGTKDDKILFYTALYHTLIQPNNIADADRRYRGSDGRIYDSKTNEFYSTMALWDTFRAAHPLYTIIVPEKNAAFMNSLFKYYKEQGILPVWPQWALDSNGMVGNHAVPVMVDAYLKGHIETDGEELFEAIKQSLVHKSRSKYDWKLYDKYGFLPSDKINAESVSRTLEAGFDDWCAAQLAKSLGKEVDYGFFTKRSQYYNNLFDPKTGFMRGKLSTGEWVEPFDPMEVFHAGSSNGDYTEGNAWQWLWSVQHDAQGLMDLLGGKKVMERKLDEFFALEPVIYGKGKTHDVSGLIGQYAHGNEPSHHVIYLYNYVDKPHKAQKLIDQVLRERYSTAPDGLCGNDDFGQMSAWYVLSSLGFYPVNPVSGIFDIGRPSFKYAKLKVGDNEFVIHTDNLSPENKYVERVYLNGKPLSELKISYKDIMEGGEIRFVMTSNKVD